MSDSQPVGSTENKCYGVLINGSPDIEDAEIQHSWAAFHLKEQGCDVYAATIDKPDYADKYYKPTKKGIAKMFGELANETDGDSDIHLFIYTHGATDSLQILSGSLSKKSLESYIGKMDFAKMAVMMSSCLAGIWQSIFAQDPRILFMSQGSPGELTYQEDFPIWSEWEKVIDVNGDDFVNYSEAFSHFGSDVASSTPIFIGGWAYDDIGIENASHLPHHFKDEVIDIASPDMLDKELGKLGQGEYAFVQCATGKEKTREEDVTLFVQQAKAAHGRFGFFAVESNDLSAYRQCAGGGTKMFGTFLPEDGLEISKKHKFALWEIPDILADEKRQAMRRAIQDSDWKTVSELLKASKGSLFIEELADMVIEMDAKHQVPLSILSTVVLDTYYRHTAERAFRHLIARADATEDCICEILDKSASLSEGSQEMLLASLLEVRVGISAELLMKIVLSSNKVDTCKEAFDSLLALTTSDDEIEQVLQIAKKDGWNIYNDMVDATCNSGRNGLCKKFGKIEVPAQEDTPGAYGGGTIRNSMSVSVVNGAIKMTLGGSCDTNAGVANLVEKEAGGLCSSGKFVETGSNADARKCVNGGFSSVLTGYCK